MDTTLVNFGDSAITVGSLLLGLGVVLALWLLARITSAALSRYAQRHPDVTPSTAYTLVRLVKYVFIGGGILLALDVMGLPLGHLAVFTGALGVGLGFGLKEVFNNFIAGLILLFDRSLKVGDFIELDADVRGRVRSINIRFTCITTNDDIDILIPNSDLISGRVTNWTHGSVTRRVIIPFGAAYGVPKEKVRDVVVEAAKRVPFTATTAGEHAPTVWLTGFGDSAVNYALVVWLDEQGLRQYRSVLAAYMWEIDTALNSAGIEIPFPQRDLRIRSVFGLEGEAALETLAPMRERPKAESRTN